MFNIRKKEKEVPKNIEDITEELSKIKEENKKIKEELSRIKTEQSLFLQNIAMIRFNPFNEEGGNHSFSLAILNGEGDGLVITSLYTKENNRIYGKPVEKGKSKYPLSEEEKSVINSVFGVSAKTKRKKENSE